MEIFITTQNALIECAVAISNLIILTSGGPIAKSRTIFEYFTNQEDDNFICMTFSIFLIPAQKFQVSNKNIRKLSYFTPFQYSQINMACIDMPTVRRKYTTTTKYADNRIRTDGWPQLGRRDEAEIVDLRYKGSPRIFTWIREVNCWRDSLKCQCKWRISRILHK